ncbi:MAG: DUF1428 domain-containing protein [Paracoccaceae bacterium]
MSYFDGFVAAVPTANKQAYVDHAKFSWEIFKDHGALETVECWGEDGPEGEVTSFPMAVKCADDETVVFSWIRWASKEARDMGWAAIMEDPRMQDASMTEMPFDGKRLIFGGFASVMESGGA